MGGHRRVGRHHRHLRCFLAANPFCVLAPLPLDGRVDQRRAARFRRTDSELGHLRHSLCFCVPMLSISRRYSHLVFATIQSGMTSLIAAGIASFRR
jgi:hypothetical protein